MKNFDGLSIEEKAELLELEESVELEKAKPKLKNNFLSFVKYVWPEFIQGSHHKVINEKFNQLAEGKIKRLIINMPPRHTKSEFASFLLPAWMIGKDPKLKIIQATHTADLAVDFGRKTKNLVDQEDYKQLFDTRLMEDSQAAGKWKTEQGGEYFAAGVGGAITGRGADLLIIDDPHKEQDIKKDSKSFDKAWNWYTSGPRQRLQPGGKIVCVMTRWSTKDLTGQMIKAQGEEGSDEWEVVRLPAILPSKKPVWPEYWSLDELEKTKASIPVSNWNAQYQQEPTAEEGAIIKRDWWQDWTHKEPPEIKYTVQSYDTAFLKKESADFSAITTWGVFETEDNGDNIILLSAFKDRYEFPELRRVAHEEYLWWRPDMVLIEAKASGIPLTSELRNMGIPVVNFTPSRGNDKHVRVNSVSPLFESGKVWAPMHEHFAQEVVEECASFPFGDYDDYVDSMTQALMRIRQGGLIRHPEDYQDEPTPKRKIEYYG
jgi:predicted phage terminase large subunit-like protein|tara:strand:- start:17 stop:1480 length:1464 start_codon:yes stop_codon:yes gene_type:complete